HWPHEPAPPQVASEHSDAPPSDTSSLGLQLLPIVLNPMAKSKPFAIGVLVAVAGAIFVAGTVFGTFFRAPSDAEYLLALEIRDQEVEDYDTYSKWASDDRQKIFDTLTEEFHKSGDAGSDLWTLVYAHEDNKWKSRHNELLNDSEWIAESDEQLGRLRAANARVAYLRSWRK
ncbi:MAG: hypothetical protein KDA71_15105, partial [Planctomycetales bacterium]|nr:hypothetical protein [Planctomycetales bacterium]